ncbi:hypothetical protein N7533_005453 [Penicillium manginii]|uniref:uncharacterized protein n=1 Tax=Penicillium manginii TaxID=203109 RepID=UPI0025469607|nr:uncharacterized protein N7533_005453 [Penicillium manginii]KAJ5755910.1 hypothetical protein N7533_005453 [Penicillium manginii]
MKTARAVRVGTTGANSRFVSGTSNTRSSVAASNILQQFTQSPPPPRKSLAAPLAKLPFSSVLRSLLVLSVSSSPILLKPCIYTLSHLAHPRSAFWDVSKNPLLNFLVKHTIYKQFNAGENKVEVQDSIRNIKQLGCRGVLLGYAREVLVGENQDAARDEKAAMAEIQMWFDGTMRTVDMAQQGDFVALKFTGMGTDALRLLQKEADPTEFMDSSILKVCDLAISRGVRLLVDAEEQAVQPGYLRSTPATLARHLETARQEGYTLGVKLVRGAYMKTEPRHLIWAKKEDTDRCYDEVVEALLTRKYNSMLQAPTKDTPAELPSLDVIIATHNRDSVRKAHAIRMEQAVRGEDYDVDLSYAQLQGMADEVSCELLEGFENAENSVGASPVAAPNVFKLLTWGSVQECMGFLLRRAIENTEAVGRTKDSQVAMFAELKRRCRNAFARSN